LYDIDTRRERIQADAMMRKVAVYELRLNLPGRVMINQRSMDRPIRVYRDVIPAMMKYEWADAEFVRNFQERPC
jgi:hypothetical protein